MDKDRIGLQDRTGQGQDYMCIQMIIAFVMLWYLILDFYP